MTEERKQKRNAKLFWVLDRLVYASSMRETERTLIAIYNFIDKCEREAVKAAQSKKFRPKKLVFSNKREKS